MPQNSNFALGKQRMYTIAEDSPLMAILKLAAAEVAKDMLTDRQQDDPRAQSDKPSPHIRPTNPPSES